MRSLAVVLLLIGTAAERAWAAEALAVPPTLEQQLDALDATDAEIARLQDQITAAAPAERKALNAQLTSIEAFQAALLNAIEQTVGPLPATPARPAPPALAPTTALETQLEQQRRKDEPLLDRPVIRD